VWALTNLADARLKAPPFPQTLAPPTGAHPPKNNPPTPKPHFEQTHPTPQPPKQTSAHPQQTKPPNSHPPFKTKNNQTNKQANKQPPQQKEELESEFKEVTSFLKEALGERVEKVRGGGSRGTGGERGAECWEGGGGVVARRQPITDKPAIPPPSNAPQSHHPPTHPQTNPSQPPPNPTPPHPKKNIGRRVLPPPRLPLRPGHQ
jgi:hypothetical protein